MKWDREARTEPGSVPGQVAGACECGNEHVGSIQCREFLRLAEKLLAYQGGLCFMELVRLGALHHPQDPCAAGSVGGLTKTADSALYDPKHLTNSKPFSSWMVGHDSEVPSHKAMAYSKPPRGKNFMSYGNSIVRGGGGVN